MSKYILLYIEYSHTNQHFLLIILIALEHLIASKQILLSMEKIKLPTGQHYDISVHIYDTLESSATLVIAGATGTKQQFYSHFARYLANQGFRVVTFDYGGIGESKSSSLKKFDTTIYNWGANDLHRVLEFVEEKFPEEKYFILGHSIGGQILGLSKHSTKASGIFLFGSTSGYWKLFPGLSKWKVFTFWKVIIPIFTKLYGYFPAKKLFRYEDLPKSVALQWKRWGSSKNYLFDHVQPKRRYHADINCPLFAYSTSDDKIAPKKAVNWMTSKYENCSIHLRRLIPSHHNVRSLGHFNFFNKNQRHSFWKMFVNDMNSCLPIRKITGDTSQ